MRFPDFFSPYKKFSFQGTPGGIRENCRCYAIVTSQVDIYENARVLDLGGFWGSHSFAALEHGARSATIVDVRIENIDNGKRIFEANNISPDKYNFIQGDVHDVIPTFKPGEFDIVLVCGLICHTGEHYRLIEAIAKHVAPNFQVYDTVLYGGEQAAITPLIHYQYDDTLDLASAWSERNEPRKLIGWPTRSALKFMLECTGYEFYYEFPKIFWARWFSDGSNEDYILGLRATLFFAKRNGLSNGHT